MHCPLPFFGKVAGLPEVAWCSLNSAWCYQAKKGGDRREKTSEGWEGEHKILDEDQRWGNRKGGGGGGVHRVLLTRCWQCACSVVGDSGQQQQQQWVKPESHTTTTRLKEKTRDRKKKTKKISSTKILTET